MISYLELNFGKSFTGKTARMLYELRDERRVVLADPKCAQLTDLKNYDHLWPFFDDELGMWLGKDFVNYFRKRQNCQFRAIVHLRNKFREQIAMLCRLLSAMKNVSLAVDELGLFFPPGNIGALSPSVTSLAISGRHEGMKFTGTAQSPSLVHYALKMNAEKIRWYRLTEKNSLDDARLYMPREIADSLPVLPNYVCVETSDQREPFRDESLVGKIKIFSPKTSKN